MDVTESPSQVRRLDSWKEIGSFFGRDERTVKRWERERRLPVHRVPGSGRGRVFAYQNELEEWLRDAELEAYAPEAPIENASHAPPPAPSASHIQSPHGQVEGSLAREADSADTRRGGGKLLELPRLALVSRLEAGAAKPAADPVVSEARPSYRRWLWPAVAGALLIVAIAGVTAYRSRTPAAVVSSPTAHAADPAAEDLYLKGVYYWQKRTPESLHQAVDAFTQAIVRDPGYAPAYAGLAECYDLLREFDTMPAEEAYPRAIEAAQRAIQLDPHSAVGHRSLAFAQFWGQGRVEEARAEFEKAIAEDPNSATGHHWFATYLMTIGENERALQEIDTARRLDPSSIAIQADKGMILQAGGQQEQARQLLEELEKSDPSFPSTHSYLSAVYLMTGDNSGFVRELRNYGTMTKDARALAIADAAGAGLAQGGRTGMLESVYSYLRGQYEQGKTAASQVAFWALMTGRYDDALDFWEKGADANDRGVLGMNSSPSPTQLRMDPRFVALQKRLGLPVT